MKKFADFYMPNKIEIKEAAAKFRTHLKEVYGRDEILYQAKELRYYPQTGEFNFEFLIDVPKMEYVVIPLWLGTKKEYGKDTNIVRQQIFELISRLQALWRSE